MVYMTSKGSSNLQLIHSSNLHLSKPSSLTDCPILSNFHTQLTRYTPYNPQLADMAALGFLDVFSLISGGLGILQFGMDNFKAPDSVGSTIDITVGLDYSGGLSNAGGE